MVVHLMILSRPIVFYMRLSKADPSALAQDGSRNI